MSAPAGAGVDRFLVRAGLFLLLLAGLALLLRAPLANAFRISPYLNGLILVLFLFGAGYTLRCLGLLRREQAACARVARLAAEVRAGTRAAGEAAELMTLPSLGAVGEFLARVRLTLRQADAQQTLPFLLETLAGRGEDARALVRFLGGTLVLIGLIGTFYGLLLSTEGVRDLLGTAAGGDGADWLANLRARLSTPLTGMGTGFATSLFGLVCSAALGFLELQLFHAQSAVTTRLETLVVTELLPVWQTPALIGREQPVAPRYLLAVAEALIERLDRVAGLLEAAAARDDAGRLAQAVARGDERVQALGVRLERESREQNAALMHELRVIARYMARDTQPPVVSPQAAEPHDAPPPR
ncbi:MAG TPA: hypothetical protein PLP98_16060 [Plasticicumulans sp.]|nr:hypothetical protein [Plasticicumulans sp.]